MAVEIARENLDAISRRGYGRRGLLRGRRRRTVTSQQKQNRSNATAEATPQPAQHFLLR